MNKFNFEKELHKIQDQIIYIVKQIIISDGNLRLEYERTYNMLCQREREVKLEICRERSKRRDVMPKNNSDIQSTAQEGLFRQKNLPSNKIAIRDKIERIEKRLEALEKTIISILENKAAIYKTNRSTGPCNPRKNIKK